MFNNINIIITTNTYKKELLKQFNKELLNIKIYTINEFNKLYYYDYNNETIIYIMHKYNVIYEIAKIYLNNLIYINNKKYKSKKLNFLKELKQDLIDNKLLKINTLFKHSLSNKNILIYNIEPTKEIELLIKELKPNTNINIINEEKNNYKEHNIYELNTIEEEIIFVSNEICKLLKKGIDIKNIYITNLNEEYYKLINIIFPMYHIPYTINNSSSIYGTYISNKFLEYYNDNIEETINKLKEIIITEEDNIIYNQILDIVNNYAFINNYNEVLPIIKYELKNTKLKQDNNLNSIHEVDLNSKFTDEDYVFLLSFNQGIIPTIYKDEDYLTDIEKEELNISLTIDKNNISKEQTIKTISSIKNLIITTKKECNGEQYTISNINEILNYNIIKPEIEYNYSNLYNQIKLTSLKDEYNKYGTITNDLLLLNNTYPKIPYNTYDNKYTNIDKNDLKEYLNNKLTLSYTKVDKYYKCPFSYYINYILNLNIYEDTFYQKIGTLFHAILEKYNKTKLTYEELWQQELNNLNTTFNNKELFFLEKLYTELEFIIETIKEQEEYTNLKEELHEEKIYTSIIGEMTITFSGIIDKIKYKKEDNKTIIAIIDYKTGSVDTNLSTIPYGIGMQLPVYLYLAHNTNKIENIEVAGFYLQHILNNEIAYEKGKTYIEQKKKSLLLQGYSNDNISILKEFDTSYDNSNIIKSMSLTKNLNFSRYAKVLTTNEMNILKDIAEKNIKEASTKIINTEFNIEPKKIGDINYGCEYCKYKDICYHTPKDIVELKELTKEDIFGGEE